MPVKLHELNLHLHLTAMSFAPSIWTSSRMPFSHRYGGSTTGTPTIPRGESSRAGEAIDGVCAWRSWKN